MAVLPSLALVVIPAGKRVSNARDGNLKYIPVVWIPAVHAGMTGFVTFVYNDESLVREDESVDVSNALVTVNWLD